MSMRALWAVLFVLAPLAAVAGYGSTYGVTSMGGSGGGVTVGDAVSGGTASRLVFSDGSGLVSTATPALGAALTLSGALSGTSSQFTGQMVFSGVTTDISTGTNETLTITPNGTGAVSITSAATVGGAFTATGNTSLGGTLSSTYASACFTGMPTGNLCVTDDYIVHSSGSAANIFVTKAGTTAASAGTTVYNSSNTNVAGLRYFGSAHSATALQDKIALTSASAGPVVLGEIGADEAAGTAIVEIRDGVNSANLLNSFDGVGTLAFHNSTTIPAGDCDADADVGRVRRYAKDANNITLCGCTKNAGVFSWAAAIAGGDCT